jgi:hypothetical protein
MEERASFAERVRHEVRDIGLVTAFFLSWFLLFLSLKKLVLAEYQIGVRVLGTALISALVVAKVVVILDKTPAAKRFRSSLVAIHVLWQSIAYTAVVLLVTLGERLFHAYRQRGNLGAAFTDLWISRDFHHGLATAISVGLAFVVFHGALEIDRRLGDGGLRRLFFSRRA